MSTQLKVKDRALSSAGEMPAFESVASGLGVQRACDRPEAELLLACARTNVDDRTARRISQLLEGDLDWSFVIQKAQQNCVMPLLCWNLVSVCPDRVPKNVLLQLRDFHAAHARHNLLQTAQLIKLLRLFADEGIQALSFKGPILALWVYGNISLRQFGDLDILVHRKGFRKAIELLVAQGYQRDVPEGQSQEFSAAQRRRKDLVLVNESNNTRIELHWRLSGTHFNFPLDLQCLWEKLGSLNLAGAQVRCLPPNELLVYLSLHGSRHGWERLSWICDVAELIRTNPELDWPKVIEQAQSLGCERALMLALLLASELLDASVPTFIRRKLQGDSELNRMAAHVRERLYREPGDSLKLSDWYFYHLGMKERPRDKVRLHLHYYYRYLRLALKPNRKDHALVSLPTLFSFLYYLLRPLRLVNERVWEPIKSLVRSP